MIVMRTMRVVGIALAALALGTAPALASATPTWTVVPSANPTLAQGELNAVTCLSATRCFGVGGVVTASGEQIPLIEVWTGTGWRVQASPAPPAGSDSELSGVACSNPRACIAVGQSTDTRGEQITFAEAWNGTVWTITAMTSDGSSQFGELAAVSCRPPGACVAVGAGVDGATGFPTPLAMSWNGVDWSPQAAVPPHGNTEGAQLTGVSCAMPGRCLAVGNQFTSTSETVFGELSNGGSWGLTPIPLPTGTTLALLAGVSCGSSDRCTAVGLVQIHGANGGALAENWNGTVWSMQAAARTAGPTAQLSAVSCFTASRCEAVGGQPPANVAALARSGAAWTNQPVPNPAGSPDPSLLGVSCVSRTFCLGVGLAGRGDGEQLTLGEVWDGSLWHLVPTPTPGGAAAPATLFGASCSSATSCVSVGSLQAPFGGSPLAELWTGSSWSLVPTAALTGGASSGELGAVSCPTATFCLAVGQAGTNALAETWNGSGWSLTGTVPSGTHVKLLGVSCRSATSCLAVGRDQSGPVAALWNGSTWAMQTLPALPGAVLSAVSCSTATACTAVGDQVVGGDELVLALRFNGTTWTAQSMPNPGGGQGGGSFVKGVSCSGPTDCAAVGFSNESGVETSIAEVWHGGTWTLTPVPSGSAITSSLAALSCSSASACVAVGARTPSGTVALTYAVSWNGSSWTQEVTADPGGATQDQLFGVSCPVPTSCQAVGSSGIGTLGESRTG